MALFNKKDLQAEVENYNKKHCSKTKNELAISSAYGGHKVVLTGKKRKDGKGWRGIGTAQVDITNGYGSPKEAIFNLINADVSGKVKRTIKHYEKTNKGQKNKPKPKNSKNTKTKTTKKK